VPAKLFIKHPNQVRKVICFLLILFPTIHAFSQQQTVLISDTANSQSITKRIIEIDEVQVKARIKDANILSGSTGLSVDVTEIKLLPTILNEADPLKALQYMGGVTQSGEGNSGLYVRGGNNDQNLILLNGALIHNPTHVLGLFSIFNADIVERMRFIKTGIPAEYGGRLSSVVDIGTVNTVSDSFKLDGSVGLISSRISAQFPLSDKLLVYGSLRGSYLNSIVLPAITFFGVDTTLTRNQYDYVDCNLGLVYQLNERTKISSHLYYGKDDILIKEVYKYRLNENAMFWSNRAATLELNHLFSNQWSMNHLLSYSDFKLRTNLEWNNSGINMKSGFENINYKADFFYTNKKHQIKFGTEVSTNFSSPQYVISDSLVIVDIDNEHNTYRTAQLTAYFRDEYSIGNFQCNIGIRSNVYAHLGPYTDYIATNKTVYPKNIPIKTYYGIEPRLFMRYLFNDQSSVKASATHHIQYLNQIPVVSLGIPIDILIPASLHILPQSAWHFSGGYFRNFSKNRYELSTEVYYKQLNNQLEYNSGLIETYTNKMIEKNVLNGRGWSYGVELKFRKTEGAFTGWISYNLAWNYRQFDQLNNGKPYFDRNDRRHDLSVIGMYKLNDRWNFSVLFVYASGSRLNMPLSWFIIDNKVVLEYGKYNAFVMPPFHRLDLSANYKLKPFMKIRSELNFSVYNAYNRANPFRVYYSTIKHTDKGQYDFNFGMSYLLPIVPTISWTFHL
jgi:hypothetical protein